MNGPANQGVASKTSRKQVLRALAATMLAPPARTIFVGFPTPSVVQCTPPFHASGNNDPNTGMDQTARIITPTGELVGNLLPNPDPPFTWTYEFTDPLPSGVPLALVVRGTVVDQIEEVIVPFECQ
jgi:hypothetical protein